MNVPVVVPFRLDLTVAVLRRFSTNVVDVVAPDGTYRRALESGADGPYVVAVRQPSAALIDIRIECGRGDEAGAVALVRRMLGTDRTIDVFDRGASRVSWLRDLAARMRGVKPPRYATLWEACVNAILFQQVSLHAASAILRRTILALGDPLVSAETTLHAIPTIDRFLAASDTTLRTAGLSINKIATLRRVGEALRDGAFDEATLERHSTAEASTLLCAIKGIGPWTAAVILLRGLGRLDVFPQNDSGVARGVTALTTERAALADALAELGAERGMLYYHLLLARLEARGEVVA
ncbi:MAG: DNA-3-methyladenine glycosylase 2 family protein [Candidatus Eremiobacteraeota bacterium]|nr:DNA-3-methyladenine glycosylase 2 family protein [Candidatus Eremiobacteraeota bacterium]